MDIASIIVSATPAITAVIGIVVALIVGIKKIKRATGDTTREVKRFSEGDKELKQHLREVQRENAELKHQLDKVMAKLTHVHFVDKEE